MNSFDCVKCAAMMLATDQRSQFSFCFGTVYTAESFGSILLSAFMSERRILCASAGQTSEQLGRRGIDFGLSRIGEVWFERKTMERSQALVPNGSTQHITTPNTPTKIVNDIYIYLFRPLGIWHATSADSPWELSGDEVNILRWLPQLRKINGHEVQDFERVEASNLRAALFLGANLETGH